VSPNVGSAATARRRSRCFRDIAFWHISDTPSPTTAATHARRRSRCFRDIAFGHISDTLLAVTPVADPRSSDRIFGQKAASPEWHHRRALGAPGFPAAPVKEIDRELTTDSH
jgi:hypothetical protein